MPKTSAYNRGRTVKFTYNLIGNKLKITHPTGKSKTINRKTCNVEDDARSAGVELDNEILDALEKKRRDRDIAEKARIEEEKRNKKRKMENDDVDSAIDVDPSPDTDSSSIPQP